MDDQKECLENPQKLAIYKIRCSSWITILMVYYLTFLHQMEVIDSQNAATRILFACIYTQFANYPRLLGQL